MKKVSIILSLFLFLTYATYQKDSAERIFIVPSETGYDIYEIAIEYREHPDYYKEKETEDSKRVIKARVL